MDEYIFETSRRFSDLLDNIGNSEKGRLLKLVSEKDPAVVLFYCTAHDLGQDIIEFEKETIELIFAEKGYSYGMAEKVNAMIAIVNLMDYVLSTADGFMYASVILNDLDGVPDNIDSLTSEQMIWAVILLMAIFNASNFPLVGDAVKALAAKLLDEGWTTPPLLLKTDKLFDIMPYSDKNLHDVGKQHKDRFFHITNPNTKANIDNQFDNFFDMHKSILFYMEQEDKLFDAVATRLV